MFIGLLVATLGVALALSTLAVLVFVRPVRRILRQIVAEDISSAWVRYLVFAMYVVGVAGGVNVRRLERYITSPTADAEVLALTRERWIIELYSSGIGALAAITWMLLVFFVVALVAYVVVRVLHRKPGEPPKARDEGQGPGISAS
jgi:hypothetical protein